MAPRGWSEAARAPERPARLLPALGLCAAFGVAGVVLMDRGMGLGWDESMHAQLPAARMVLGLRAGETGEAFEALLGCQQYPFVYPVLLALVQALTGLSEDVARASGRVIWALGAFGVFLCARRAADVSGWLTPVRQRLAPWVALVLALASPLALAYSATLFQEVPFLALSAFALAAWLARDGRPSRELIAGAWITAAFFTRFNTGLLLGFALFLDLLVEGGGALRSAALRPWLRRVMWLAAPPGAAFAWWFLWPFPAGPDVGAAHREALAGFLAGNRGQDFRIGWERRWLDWMVAFSASPRLFLLQALALVATLPALLRPGLRTLWILFLAGGLPVWLHEFHLDRFHLHQGLSIWCLAGLGLARFLPGPRPAWVAAALLPLGLVARSLDARPVALALLGEPATPEARSYVLSVVDRMGSLHPGRRYETAGLARAEADAVIDLIAAEVGPRERVGWLGINSELSPAAVHLGLLDRGGAPERFRADAARARPDGQPDMCLSFLGVDPGWDEERLSSWAQAFDVVITSRPVDFKGRAGREWVHGYQDRLLMQPGWGVKLLGAVQVRVPVRDPVTVEILACRRR